MHTGNHVLLHCCLWQLQGVHEGHCLQALAQSLKGGFCVASLPCRQSTTALLCQRKQQAMAKSLKNESLGLSVLPAGREDGCVLLGTLSSVRLKSHAWLEFLSLPTQASKTLCRRLARVISALPVSSPGSTLRNTCQGQHVPAKSPAASQSCISNTDAVTLCVLALQGAVKRLHDMYMVPPKFGGTFLMHKVAQVLGGEQ